jgi:hypothetical protein
MSDHANSRTGATRVGQVKEITSLSNPIIKDIRALSMKKHRDETGTFLAEGLKLVIDAIDLGWTIRTLIYAKAQRGKPQVEKIAALTVARGGLVLGSQRKGADGDHAARQPAGGDCRLRPETGVAWRDFTGTGRHLGRARPGSRSGQSGHHHPHCRRRRRLRRDPDRRDRRPVLDGNGAGHHGIGVRRAPGAGHRSRVPELVEEDLSACGRQPSQGQRRLPHDRLQGQCRWCS